MQKKEIKVNIAACFSKENVHVFFLYVANLILQYTINLYNLRINKKIKK